MQPEIITQLIKSYLPDSEVNVTGDDGSHFEAIIVSESFANKRPLQRQQLVYQALGEHITNGDIHAISMKTYTLAEWDQYHG